MEQGRRAAQPNGAILYERKRNPYLLAYERERNMRMSRRQNLEYVAVESGMGQRSAQRPQAAGKQQGSPAYRGAQRQQGNPAYRDAGRQQGNPRAAEMRRAAARRRKRAKMCRTLVTMSIMFVTVLGIYLFVKGGRADAADSGFGYGQNLGGNGIWQGQAKGLDTQGLSEEDYAKHPEWTENFLTPNEYSRPGEPLEQVTNIFVHYTANPGTSAAQNRSYFERQKDEHQASVSSHFIIGYEGEIIQCVPLNEIAYAVKSRNYDSVSIECCHKAKDGSFTQETYDSLISLLAWLTEVYDLGTEDILRHYDCGGKLCPLYYTEHEDEWEQLKRDVGARRS